MKNLSVKDYVFVGIQGVLFILYTFPPLNISFILHEIVKGAFLVMAGWGLLKIILALVQLNRHLSPFPTPKNNAVLIQTGLFKHVRHPIYSGIILFAIGYGFYTQEAFRLGVAILLWVLFYYKSNYEEELLSKHFADYKDYMLKTNKFFSFFKRG